MRRLAGWILAFVALAACTGEDPNLTERGEGKPRLEASFPDRIAPGSDHPLEVAVTNPGPGDMTRVVVTFSAAGVGGGAELPEMLIGPGRSGRNPRIVSVSPEPDGVSPDAVVYTFGALAQGSTSTITFEIEAPAEPGRYATAIIVYEGNDPTRARGVTVETTVGE